MSQLRIAHVLPVMLFVLLASVGSVAAQDATAPGTVVSAPEMLKAVTLVPIGKADAVDATDNPCTASTGYVDMPGMAKTFKLAGTVARPVIALFQGEWISGTDRAIIRLVIDGVVQSGPGDSASPFAPHEGSGVATNGFNFISNTIAPGTHTARIQWASVSGGLVCVDERSLIILHK